MSDQSAKPQTDACSFQSDETAVTEIELTPDGRIYLFGASPQFLMLLRYCGLSDEFTADRLPETIKSTENSGVLARNDGSR